MQLGPLKVSVISGGTLRLDGGNMFGPVPRVLWERKATPDDRHRIAMDTNCLLVETGPHRVLIDTGYGSKADARQRDFQGLEAGNPIVATLSKLGLQPVDITHVILTHLHFDHAGGCTTRGPAGQLDVVFPNAKHFVQKVEWEDAVGRSPELAGSYFADDFEPIAQAGLLQLVDGSADILPGIRLRKVGGHTRGLQIVELGASASSPPLGYVLSDLVPTTWHLKTFWHVSYDQYPVELRRTKPVVLNEVVRHGAQAFFCHDTVTRWAYLRRDGKQEFEIDPSRR
jgi:glyoxylase-like metal-dependent hydrolase (beta-lactamase superfamily II)